MKFAELFIETDRTVESTGCDCCTRSTIQANVLIKGDKVVLLCSDCLTYLKELLE